MKNTDFSIRHATAEDYDAVCTMVQALALEEGSDSLFNVHNLSDFLKVMPDAICLMAHNAEALLGCALAYAGYDIQSATKGWHLSDIYVMPDARAQGIGKALMLALQHHKTEYKWTSWTVMRENKMARKFYAAIGAEEVDVCFMAMSHRM